MASLIHLISLLFWAAVGVEGARVLMMVPSGGKSQKNVFYGIGHGLVSHGHEVVFFNAFKPSSPVKGIREVVPDKLAEALADKNFPSMFKMQEEGIQAGFKQYGKILAEGPRAALASKELDQLLKEKFDVVLFGAFGYPFYFVAHVLNAPFILVTPVSYFPVLTSSLGNPTIPALHPSLFTAVTSRMTFFQRVQNLVGSAFPYVMIGSLYSRYSDSLVAEKFGEGVMPSALDIERNASLVFVNSNPAKDYHVPLLPNAIQIGGAHCTEPKPLPKDLTVFLGDSEFVYFSLGSVVRPQDMSTDQKSAVLEALGSLPFKVLLKWDTTDRSNIPRNILPSKWLPQQDILGNKKCRLFISHGGFASVVEAICHGVPSVMLPVAADQIANAALAVDLGVSEMLTWKDLTSETLKAAINSALSPSHLAASRYRQELLASQPVPPRDLAVHWVEHVIKHGGAPHLKSVGADLNFFQYYSLDVLAFLLAVLVVLLKLFVALFKCCCSCLCRRKAGQSPSDAKAKGKRAKRD